MIFYYFGLVYICCRQMISTNYRTTFINILIFNKIQKKCVRIKKITSNTSSLSLSFFTIRVIVRVMYITILLK